MLKTFIFTLLIASISFAQSAGNSGLSFLKFGFGARNIAMGDAGVAASNDLSALFYNPSRLVSTEMNEVIFMHDEWIQDIRSEVGGIKWNMFNLPWAVGFNVTTVDDIEVRERPGEPISKFNANYFFGSLSSGFTVIDDLDFGMTFKYLYEGLLNDESTGYGFDFGLNYFTPIEGLSASTVIRNVGSMSELRVEKTKLPTEFRIGGAYNFSHESSKTDFVVVTELQKYLDTDDIHFIGGLEGVYSKTFALRIGYQSGYESRSITGGVGIMWNNLRFDYAYMPFSLGLGNANLFSIQFKF
ncbi:MAG: PorV/PorQ family protein [Ignavibacteriaceae bacterium]|nr:PorV/PorQ family protein [Ignavibacteriaceae bacterium]